jgi:hypothetical protein
MSTNFVKGNEHEDYSEVCAAVYCSIAWKSAGNFENSFKRIQTFFRRLSLAPSDFFLFSKMKIGLKGRRFYTAEEIQAKTQTVLNTLTKKYFQYACEKWQKRWDRCMLSQGDNFEGDGAEWYPGKT